MDKKIKEAIRRAELEIKRKHKEEWQGLAEKIGKQKIGKIRETLKRFTDYYIAWKRLEKQAPKGIYDKWYREVKNEPLSWELLERLKLRLKALKAKKCKARDCGNLLIPKRSDQVYCSTRCRDREAKRRYRERKKELSTG